MIGGIVGPLTDGFTFTALFVCVTSPESLYGKSRLLRWTTSTRWAHSNPWNNCGLWFQLIHPARFQPGKVMGAAVSASVSNHDDDDDDGANGLDLNDVSHSPHVLRSDKAEKPAGMIRYGSCMSLTTNQPTKQPTNHRLTNLNLVSSFSSSPFQMLQQNPTVVCASAAAVYSNGHRHRSSPHRTC